MSVKVDVHPEFDAWRKSLPEKAQKRILAFLLALEQSGRSLGPPASKPLKGGLLHELRPTINGHDIRILYAFREDGSALVLVGGDKTGNWDKWYPPNIERATKLLAEWKPES